MVVDRNDTYTVAMNLLDGLLRLHSSSVPLEDFFTEACAGLFRYHPALCLRWLEEVGALPETRQVELVSVSTQVRLSALEDHETGSRPDLTIRTRSEDGDSSIVLVETKVGSTEGGTQLKRYAEHLETVEGMAHKVLVYVTRDYDPKDPVEILINAEGVGFKTARWNHFYRQLKAYQGSLAERGERSDLVEEIRSFMEVHGMSQQHRLSAADVATMGGIPRVFSFMSETLADEVQSKVTEVSGHKVAGRLQNLRQVEDFSRYLQYASMSREFWCGAGFNLEGDHPEDYPWLTVFVEVGPRQPQREEIIGAMRSWAAEHPTCESYDLDDPSAWSALEWRMDLGKLLGEEDHMAAARRFFSESLDSLKSFREEYPDLPWGNGS